MKNIILLVTVFCFVVGEVVAQNRTIEFKEGNWETILKQARKEKKKIFVDCYTSWCGPCKMLAKTVFTNDTVADYFNRHFVNVKIDMEKGEGPALAKKYEVRAFPTLLFLDRDGKLVHCLVGFQKVGKLISEAQTALDGGNTLDALQKKYESGERNPAFVRQYIAVLSEAYRPVLQREVATEFVNTMSEEQFYTRNCWDIISLNITDPMSPLIRKMFVNRNRFYKIVAKDTVDMFLDYTFKSKVSGFTWWEPSKGTFNQQAYDEYVAYLQTLNWPKTSYYLASMYAARKMADGDYRGMLDEMYKAMSYHFFDSDDQLSYVRNYVMRLEKSGKTDLIVEARDWMDKLKEEALIGYYRSEYMRIKSGLLRALGDEEQATKLEAEARVVRMSR